MSYTEELHDLRLKVERIRHLSAVAERLNERKAELEQKLYDLRAVLQAEEYDVERLEGRSFAALFYAVIGQKAEKLDKERREAYAAKLKCDVAQQELDSVNEEISAVYAELAPLSGCANRYEVLLKLRRDELRNSKSETGEELRRLEEELAVLENHHREILEAISSGEKALSLVDSVLNQLREAQSLGNWDIWGGGTLVNLAKHDHLDSAQGQIAVLQDELRRFKNEALDVDLNVHADVKVNIEGFDRFADYFFDNVFHDLRIQDSIDASVSQVESIRRQIEPLMNQLRDMQTATQHQVQAAGVRLREFLTDAGVQ